MPLPVQAAEAQNLIKMLAGGGAGAPAASPAPGAPTSTSPEAAALMQGLTQLDGANPQGIADALRQMNSTLATLYLQTSQRIPAATTHIAKAREALERAIKEANTAAQTANAVRPIANTAGVGPSVNAQGAQPDIAALLGA